MIPTDDGKVMVRASGTGLTAGFHGFHVHSVGVCDPAAKDAAGATVPFFSAGGHYNPVTTNTHGAHAGDMPPLLVAADGNAVLRFKTDRFKVRELLDSDGSAVIMHAAPDNLANIPGTTAAGG
jgi:Cu-Zn family superoxide dismutase